MARRVLFLESSLFSVFDAATDPTLYDAAQDIVIVRRRPPWQAAQQEGRIEENIRAQRRLQREAPSDARGQRQQKGDGEVGNIAEVTAAVSRVKPSTCTTTPSPTRRPSTERCHFFIGLTGW